MNVNINGQVFKWDSDYNPNNPQNWKKKLNDAFSFQKIAGVNCFVKRFESEKPLAYDLILKLKGINPVNMPKIYDIQQTKENNKIVYYLFTENVEGKTLKEQITAKEKFNIHKILPNILESLVFLHKWGFWFSDLNEENIYYSKSNDTYYLIDIDSCWEESIKPSPILNEKGFMPGLSQEHADVVLKFYREIMNNQQFFYTDISGKNLNYLQLLTILTKLEYYLEHRKTNPNFEFLKKHNFNNLHRYLLYKNENYCKTVFTKALNGELLPPFILELGRYVTGEKVAQLDEIPVIEYFRSNSYGIFKGESVTLSWSVRNAYKLYINGLNNEGQLQQILKREVSFFYTDNRKDGYHTVQSFINGQVTIMKSDGSKYTVDANSLENNKFLCFEVSSNSLTIPLKQSKSITLYAQSKLGKETSKSVQINVKPNEIPSIEYFIASKNNVKVKEPFTISWKTTNAYILKLNDKEISNSTTSKSYILQSEGTCSFKLSVISKSGQSAEKTIYVKATNTSKVFLKVAASIVLLIGLSFGGQQIYVNKQYNNLISQANSYKSSGDYIEAVIYYVQAKNYEHDLIIGSPEYIDDDITECKYLYYKTEGDKLFDKGHILGTGDSTDNRSAFKFYKLASEYEENDYINTRLKACEYIEKAESLRKKGNYSEALTQYQNANNIVSNSRVEKMIDLCNGMIAFKNQYYSDAIPYLTSVINAYGDDFLYLYFYRGYAKIEIRDYSGAIDDYSYQISHYKGDLKDLAPSFNNRGAAYSMNGNKSQACEDYKKALDFEPNNELYQENYYYNGCN